jgi:hypothetical protein
VKLGSCYFGGCGCCCELSFLSPDCVPEGEDPDGVDGDAVVSCVDWFVV